MDNLKYAQYIIDNPDPNLYEFDFMRTRILHSNEDIVPGALCEPVYGTIKGLIQYSQRPTHTIATRS